MRVSTLIFYLYLFHSHRPLFMLDYIPHSACLIAEILIYLKSKRKDWYIQGLQLTDIVIRNIIDSLLTMLFSFLAEWLVSGQEEYFEHCRQVTQ
jgi:hypothetical protein